MNREEFITQFRKALDGKVPEKLIDDNVNYYSSYINGQIASGKSESEVLELLGEPRLLAKTIEESSKFASESQNNRNGYADDYERYGDYGPRQDKVKERYIKLPGWFFTCLIVIAVVLLITLVFHVFVYLAPFIFMFLAAGFLIRTFRNWWSNK